MSATPDHECRIVALAIEDQGGESLTKAISRGVRAEHFTDPACREIYRATCEMFRTGDAYSRAVPPRYAASMALAVSMCARISRAADSPSPCSICDRINSCSA